MLPETQAGTASGFQGLFVKHSSLCDRFPLFRTNPALHVTSQIYPPVLVLQFLFPFKGLTRDNGEQGLAVRDIQ